MEFEKILQLIESVSNSELTSFTLEEGGMKLVLEAKRGREDDSAAQIVVAQALTDGKPGTESAVKGETAGDVKTVGVSREKKAGYLSGNVVKSPLVGTFYSAPAPDADNYVKVGDTVSKGQTLGIVEAMKLMNEIECEYDGVVKEILIENGAVVEYGQPLFVIG